MTAGPVYECKRLNFLDVMGIQTKATNAFSPFANDVVERHKGVFKATMSKLGADYTHLGDNPIRLYMMLHHSTFAKNSMMDFNGCSYFLRPFGVFISILPSLETDVRAW